MSPEDRPQSGRGTAASAVAAAGLAALTVVTAAAFVPLFSEGRLLRNLVITALVVHLLAFLLRMMRWPLWAALPFQTLALVSLVAMVHHRSTLTATVIPTSDTWARLYDDLVAVWQQFPTALVPVPDDGPFAVIAMASIGLVALTSDAFAFRAYGRLESLAPAAVTFVVVSAVGGEREQVLAAALWVAVALGALALLRITDGDGRAWIGHRGLTVTARRAIGALVVVGITTVSTAWLAPRLPGAGAEALIDTKNSSSEVTQVLSPLVDIRSRLVNRSNTALFTVEADREVYWRLTGLPTFDGRTWNLPDQRLSGAGGGLSSPAGAGAVLNHTVEIRALGGNLLPAAFVPVAAGPSPTALGGEGAPLDLYYVDDTSTLVVTGSGLRRGVRVDVVSELPNPTPDELRRVGASLPADSEYLALPGDFPQQFRDIAREVVGAAPTVYDQAMALQTWFRNEFTYDLNVPPGHGEDAIADFLERRRGYCEQFAGTFAAFARSLGIPARVAVGFTSGEEDSAGRFVVRGRHAHAWPEVWFEGTGWVLFEPTPGRGAPGAEGHTLVPPEQDEGDPGTGAAPSETTTTVTEEQPPVETAPPAEPTPGAATPTTVAPPAAGTRPPADDGSGSWGSALLIGTAALLAWLLLMPPVLTRIVRLRRRTPAERVVAAWGAAAFALADTGAIGRPGDTPVEHARRAARLTGLDPSSLRELAQHATRVVYGTTDPTDRVADRCEDLRNYVASASRDLVPWPRRLRARIDPRRVTKLA